MSAALSILTEIKSLVNESGDDKLKVNTNNDLQLLISVFQNPIIKTIASVQVKKESTYQIHLFIIIIYNYRILYLN